MSGGNITSAGYVDPFSLAALSNATHSASQNVSQRYSDLGLGVPSGNPSSAAASHTNLHSTGPGTAEQMDLGNAPSLTGGVEGASEATFGQMQNNALSLAGQPSGSKGFG